MVGKIISHYKILEKIGEGGMGVVYKAEDNRLKRFVVLKFLPSHLLGSEKEKTRFVKEARAAAALNHKNICTIYDIDEFQGQTFIAMEHVTGQNLKDKIESGPLNLEEVKDITLQIAEGLRESHQKGIIHRDIKSANIMVTESGQVKIMDFGLAKAGDSVQATKPGTILGTTSYMSPEQAGGEQVDLRTDIWSLGVVIYEMLTGKLPFGGEYEQAVIYAILNKNPEPLNSFRSDIPVELEKIITSCLQNKISQRYQRIEDLISDLTNSNGISLKKLISPGSGTGGGKRGYKKVLVYSFFVLLFITLTITGYFFSGARKITKLDDLIHVAIMPFKNIRSDPDIDYLSYALAVQIIGELNYLSSISVRPSSAISIYEKQMFSIKEVGKKLNVNYVLTGDYLQEGNNIRLNVELVEVKTNDIILLESINVQYEDTFTLQDTVSRKVISALSVQFFQEERDRMQVDIPHNPRAYDLYLRSIKYPITIKGDSLAIEMLQESINLDSTFAPAFAELGYRIRSRSLTVLGAAPEIERVEKLFVKALTLNDQLLNAMNYLANLYTDIGKTEKAIRFLERAQKINPNNAETHYIYSYLYRYTGMLLESEKEAQIALKLHPGNQRFRSIALTYAYLEQYQKAISLCDMDKRSPFALAIKGEIYFRNDNQKSALEFFNSVLTLEPDGSAAMIVKGPKFYIEGDIEKSISATSLWEKTNPYDSEFLYWMAGHYGKFGDKKGCVRVLKKAIDGGFYNYPFMLKDSFLDSVRSDPEFRKVLALAKNKHEDFKSKYFPEK